MTTQLNPYITFPGTARQAMELYREVFGGDLSLMTFRDSGAEGVPDPDQLMHAHLQTPEGFVLMASDMPPGMEHSAGNGMSVSLSGDDDAALRRWWDALSEGGEVTVPLDKQMWGDVFGACTDRFGVSWMVNIGSTG